MNLVRCPSEDVAHGASVLFHVPSASDGSDGARGVPGEEPSGWRPFRVMPLYPSPSGELWAERAHDPSCIEAWGARYRYFSG